MHARRRGVDASAVLEQVFVTRTFTIHQLEAVVADMLVPLFQHEPRPLVAVLGLEHLFLEESLTLTERRQVLQRIVANLQIMRHRGLRLLITHEPPPPGQGRAWWRPLISRLGEVRGVVHELEGGRISIDVSESTSQRVNPSTLSR
jgi:hypothetical protein